MNVGAKCCINEAEIRRRFAPPESVKCLEAVVDQRSDLDPLSAWITCSVCQSMIDAVHQTEAASETPVFPARLST